jgi:hypothetical protein
MKTESRFFAQPHETSKEIQTLIHQLHFRSAPIDKLKGLLSLGLDCEDVATMMGTQGYNIQSMKGGGEIVAQRALRLEQASRAATYLLRGSYDPENVVDTLRAPQPELDGQSILERFVIDAASAERTALHLASGVSQEQVIAA